MLSVRGFRVASFATRSDKSHLARVHTIHTQRQNWIWSPRLCAATYLVPYLRNCVPRTVLNPAVSFTSLSLAALYDHQIFGRENARCAIFLAADYRRPKPMLSINLLSDRKREKHVRYLLCKQLLMF